MTEEPPRFDAAFAQKLDQLFRWRRDVRHFRADPVDGAVLARLMEAACLAPSVGHSQPWRFATVDDPARRAAVRDNFLHCNRAALADYEGERAALYARLKLEGLDQAPVHLAVFADEATEAGHGLGRKTMPEMLAYSAVMAVHTLWLAARAQGIGMGWVSILDPARVKEILEVPESWSLVAYLCLGYPQREDDTPELLREGWQDTDPAARSVLAR
jgi:5,6-dimethylbenzimidazole synthase